MPKFYVLNKDSELILTGDMHEDLIGAQVPAGCAVFEGIPPITTSIVKPSKLEEQIVTNLNRKAAAQKEILASYTITDQLNILTEALSQLVPNNTELQTMHKIITHIRANQ